MKRKDWSIYIGKTYNSLKILDTFQKKFKNRNRQVFKCKCLRCGKIFDSCTDDILRQDKRKVISCGCLQKERASEIGKIYGPINIAKIDHKKPKKYKHKSTDDFGMATPLYINWRCMMARCYYEKDICYNSYGKKDIAVFEKWHDYDNYYEWAIDNGYIEGYETHRLNNDIGYYPENIIYLSDNDHNKITVYMHRNNLIYMSKEDVYSFLNIG